MAKGIHEESEVVENQEATTGIQSTKVDENFHVLCGSEFGFFFNILGFLVGILLVWFADISEPEPELCPNIGQFWMCVQGLFLIVFHAIAFIAYIIGIEDNLTTAQEVICSLFGLYLWIGFITYIVSWMASSSSS